MRCCPAIGGFMSPNSSIGKPARVLSIGTQGQTCSRNLYHFRSTVQGSGVRLYRDLVRAAAERNPRGFDCGYVVCREFRDSIHPNFHVFGNASIAERGADDNRRSNSSSVCGRSDDHCRRWLRAIRDGNVHRLLPDRACAVPGFYDDGVSAHCQAELSVK